MCYCPTPTLHLNLALTGDGAFLFSPKKTHSVWFISVLNYGDTENVLINHLLLVIPMSYPCHYTNLCPHKHAHTHTHTHTHRERVRVPSCPSRSCLIDETLSLQLSQLMCCWGMLPEHPVTRIEFPDPVSLLHARHALPPHTYTHSLCPATCSGVCWAGFLLDRDSCSRCISPCAITLPDTQDKNVLHSLVLLVRAEFGSKSLS